MAAVGCPGELGWTVLSEPDVQGGGGFWGVCVRGWGGSQYLWETLQSTE